MGISTDIDSGPGPAVAVEAGRPADLLQRLVGWPAARLRCRSTERRLRQRRRQRTDAAPRQRYDSQLTPPGSLTPALVSEGAFVSPPRSPPLHHHTVPVRPSEPAGGVGVCRPERQTVGPAGSEDHRVHRQVRIRRFHCFLFDLPQRYGEQGRMNSLEGPWPLLTPSSSFLSLCTVIICEGLKRLNKKFE